ncbi:MAG: monofunctional biosynthetic peptidoglycan transglycosylase [Flavobacteriales bacterium]|nr:monofunctional biosynthetic peptidoglycan transglycosylase [Flavobacteriales bacterium]
MKRVRKILRFLWRWLWRGAVAFILFTFLWTLLYRWVNPPTTFLQVREWWNCPDDQHFAKTWVDYEDISFHLKLGAVASEDQNFMKHSGIDFGAIEKAVEYNKTHEKTRGASTISQQVAKNVFLWPGRSWLRKGFEVYFTVLIELLWSKERILEVYLNVAETGKCTFGVEAAAQKYFRKSAASLSKEQAALIIASLPSPRKSNPAKPSAYLTKRKEHVLRQMRLLGSTYFERYSD